MSCFQGRDATFNQIITAARMRDHGETTIGKDGWQLGWGVVRAFALPLLLTGFAWLVLAWLVGQNTFARQPAAWIEVLLLVGIHAALTWVLSAS